MSDWYETGSFCLLLTLLIVYPCLLIHGTHMSALTRVPCTPRVSTRVLGPG